MSPCFCLLSIRKLEALGGGGQGPQSFHSAVGRAAQECVVVLDGL